MAKKNDIIWRLPGSLRSTLTREERGKSVGLFLLIVVNSFVELLGLASIIPVIGAVLDPRGEENAMIRTLREQIELAFGSCSDSQFIQILVGGMLFGFVLKSVFGLFLVFVQTRFSFSVAYRLQGLLWNWHFGQSLERMRSADSGQLMAEITFWPARYVNAVLVGAIGLINDLIILTLIVSGLLVYDPFVFGSVLGLCLSGSLFIRWATKDRMAEYSGIRKLIDPRMNTTLNNAIRGVLELLAFGGIKHVQGKYMRDAKLGFRVMSNAAILGALPTRLYELLAAASVALSIFLFIYLEKEDGVFESLTLLALAAYRVMPALSRVNQKIMGLRGSAFLVEWMDETQSSLRLEKVALEESGNLTRVVPAPDGIELVGLTLGYEALKEPVIRELTFQFKRGELTSIVGPSGCGKTTLLNSILGLHRPLEGVIDSRTGSNRHSCYDNHVNAWLNNVAYLPQHPYLFGGTVGENLDLAGAGNFDKLILVELIQELGLSPVFGEAMLNFELNEGANNLSGGQQQRLALVRAFALDRPVLILDEATSALDHESRDVVMNLLRRHASKGRIVILVTHDREVAQQCDVVLDLEKHNRSHDHPWT